MSLTLGRGNQDLEELVTQFSCLVCCKLVSVVDNMEQREDMQDLDCEEEEFHLPGSLLNTS